MTVNNKSHLLIILDSCRFDVFKESITPNMDRIGNTYKARSPSFFTFPSHKAIFSGFTPAVQDKGKWLNPKHGKLYRVVSSNMSTNKNDKIKLNGKNIIDGFNNIGVETIGTGAVRWFDPNVITGKELTGDFKHYKFFGNYTKAKKQIPWVISTATSLKDPVFCFINFGETHDPYKFEGSNYPDIAAYKKIEDSEKIEDLEKARKIVFEQQMKCVEFLDLQLKPLVDLFLRAKATITITADHGELFGEDGLWQHQDMHEATTTVPLIMNVEGSRL